MTIRYVAIGDSFTEGVGDEYPDGTPRGWADRLAEKLAEARYYREYVWPWVARRLTGRSTGDNVTAKFAEWKVFEPARG